MVVTLNIDTPNLLICELQQNSYGEEIKDSQYVSSLRDQQTGPRPRPK